MILQKTILIVCEGESTEPEYFAEIRDLMLEQFGPIKVKISPKTKIEKEELKKVREGAKKRQLRDIDQQIELELKKFEIEDEYKAQPVRYVREAQKGLEDGSFDEVWAVFDKDGHPEQEKAFNLAKTNVNGKIVNIAFSSISFEHWILLHFEQNSHEFEKSKCHNKNEYYECGTMTHSKDCKGERCICGYLTLNGYSASGCYRKNFSFNDIKNMQYTAFANAVWLRNLHSEIIKKVPIYTLNPYTNIDKLVFKLLYFSDQYFWTNKEGENIPSDIGFKLTNDNKEINISITNLKQRSLIVNSNCLRILDNKGVWHSFGQRKIVEPKGIYLESIDLTWLEGNNPVYLLYFHENQLNIITDC